MEAKQIKKHNDYQHEIEVRAELNNDEKVIYGKAIVFNERTVLFTQEGLDYGEIIDRNALDEADISDVYVKYNHNDGTMVVARSKNGSLKFEIRDDGVYVEIRPANTTAGNDMYELVRTGILTKMSFGFTISEQSYDSNTRTWTVLKIKKLYEVSAVPNPAYDGTTLYARRANELEDSRAKLEDLKRRAMAVYIKTKIN